MRRNAAAFASSADEQQSIRLVASLRRLYNLMQRRIDAHSRPANLSLGRTNVLLALNGSAEGRLPLHEVAAILDVTRGNVSSLIRSLIDDGFLATEPDPADGRSLYVKLTPAGRIALRNFIPTHYALAAELCSGLRPEQREQLIELMEALRKTAQSES